MSLNAQSPLVFKKTETAHLRSRAHTLSRLYEDMRTIYAIEHMITSFDNSIAMSTSFGADSIVSLHLVATIRPDLPILFLDTDQHFLQTIQYRDEMVDRLGLTNLIIIKPDPIEVEAEDKNANLFARDTDACCALRKVRPMDKIMQSYGAWISGRKRHQAFSRQNLPMVEFDGHHFKLNPLARWHQGDIDAYRRAHNLPSHPLVAQGYQSIGCWPCTKPVEEGQDPRSGRWSGQDKTECGLHRPVFGGEGI